MRYSPYKKTRSPTPNRITPERFVEIATLATEQRFKFATSDERLPITKVLETEEANNSSFKISWHETLPLEFGDCWGCVETQFGRSVLHIQEEKYSSGHYGDWFSCHLLAHEFGHFKLKHAGINKLAPTLNGKVRTTGSIEDPAEELEADIFATFLLVPLCKLLLPQIGTQETAKRYCEEPKWIKKISFFLNVSSVKKPLISIVKERGWV